MTSTEIKELLVWARENRVAQIKIKAAPSDNPGVEVVYFPEKEVASVMAHPQQHPADRMLGLDFEDTKR